MTRQKTSHIFTKIALIPLNTNLFNIVLLSIFLTLGTCNIYSQDISKKTKQIPANKTKNKTVSGTNDKNKSDAIITKTTDTIKKDSIKPKPLLEDKIIYTAKDYVKIQQKKKLITLYNNAELKHQDIELKSGIIVLNYETNEVLAGRIKDSVGKLSQFPNFKQGENVIEPDSIRFNFKSKKALIWNSRTNQGEFKVKAVLTKKENDSVYF